MSSANTGHSYGIRGAARHSKRPTLIQLLDLSVLTARASALTNKIDVNLRVARSVNICRWFSNVKCQISDPSLVLTLSVACIHHISRFHGAPSLDLRPTVILSRQITLAGSKRSWAEDSDCRVLFRRRQSRPGHRDLVLLLLAQLRHGFEATNALVFLFFTDTAQCNPTIWTKPTPSL